MAKSFLTEAFKKLSCLDEDTFSIDDKGIKELSDFEDNDEIDDTVAIIDPEAETEEELEDSYVGKVILDCEVCHSKIYKDPTEVVVDEEEELANVGEECPFCYSADGYKIVGQVAEYCDDCDKEPKDTDDKVDDVDIDVDETEIEQESIRSRARLSKQSIKEASDSDKKMFREYKILVDGRTYEVSHTKARADEITSILTDMYPNSKVESKPYNHYASGSERKQIERAIASDNKERGINEGKLTEEPIYDLSPRYDARKSFYNKAKVDTGDKGDKNKLYSYDTLVAEIKDGKPVVYGTYSQTTLRHIKDWLKQNGFKADNGKQIMTDYGESLDLAEAETTVKPGAQPAQKKPATTVQKDLVGPNGDTVTLTDKDKFEVERKARQFKNRTAGKGMQDGGMRKISGKTVTDIPGSTPKTESFEHVEVETEDQTLSMSSDETGRVSVETAPKTPADSNEVIAPVDANVKAEIEDNTGEDEEEYTDVDFDEFDDETFDGLGEAYLKRVYNNVESYKTTDVSATSTSLKLEGIIKFTSGKTKKTNFVFEAKDATKSGKVRFLGENTQITNGKKAFTVTGTVANKKFMSESFNYNYRAKDSDGKLTRLYGTIKK